MPLRSFLEKPTTIVFDDPEGFAPDGPLIVSEAWLDEPDGKLELTWGLGLEIRGVAIGEVVLEEPGHWELKTTPRGVAVIVRPVQETDAVASTQFDSAIPLPLDVIAASLKGFNVSNELQALVGDDNYVRTILLVSDIGLYTRYAAMWHPVTDESQIDGLNAVDVADSALDVYDPFDQSGQLVSIGSLPTKDPIDRGVAEVEMTPPPAVVAGLTTVEQVEIKSARDVPRAVEVATRMPQYRWYVERRIEALQVNMVLPWKDAGWQAEAWKAAESIPEIEFTPDPVQAVGQVVDDASMVALYPDRPHDIALDLGGAEDPEVIHLTLTVMPKPDDINLDALHSLNNALAEETFEHGPYDLTVNGVDEFGKDDDHKCAVLLVDGPGLDELHELVQQKCAELGLVREDAMPWSPHITLGYGVDPSECEHLVGSTVRCSSLSSVCGRDKYTRLLGDTAPEVPPSATYGTDVDVSYTDTSDDTGDAY